MRGAHRMRGSRMRESSSTAVSVCRVFVVCCLHGAFALATHACSLAKSPAGLPPPPSDLRAAGPAVKIPLYSTVLPFLSEVKNLLPDATFFVRPDQNFESNVTVLNAVLTEFMAGETTALLAAKGDIIAVLPRADLSTPFPVDDIVTLPTSVILPVGAWLPAPGAKPCATPGERGCSRRKAAGARCNRNSDCANMLCAWRPGTAKYGGGVCQ